MNKMVFAKIYARLIELGTWKLEEVPDDYKELTKKAYKKLYGVDLNE